MCGIFGYVGKRDALSVTIEGLKKLEYRGYDSSGVAGLHNGKVIFCKEVGKVAAMETKVLAAGITLDLAVAQTRWATHGRPSTENAHPHLDNEHTLAVVHNGIIENHSSLRKSLQEKGVVFHSATDTEVIAHLLASLYQGNLVEAIERALPLLKGAYAVGVVHKDHPGEIFGFTHECPLVIGLGKEENFLASDPNAFIGKADRMVLLANNEIAVIRSNEYEVYDAFSAPLVKEERFLRQEGEEITKGGFEHYTLKEIFEQPRSLRAAMLSRPLHHYGTAHFEEMNIDDLPSIKRILILACGTSWHAGFVAEYLLEEIARIPTQVEISSEYRYKNPIVAPDTLVIAISQSGETADTLAATRELKAKGAKILALCNVYESSLSREADNCLFLRAGPEIGVCSTKAFSSQVAVLSLFTLMMARMRHMEKEEGQRFLAEMELLPEHVSKVLEQAEAIHLLAKQYAHYENFFFLGRHLMYPTALEGALKLKEIAYVNANGYPAGEMKHGPIALINEECPTLAFCAHQATHTKLLSNLQEIKARQGRILAIAFEGDQEIVEIADDCIFIPKIRDELAVISASVAAQLFAYYVALERGAEIDLPRNLAKSVTVE